MTALENLLDKLDRASSPDDPPIWVQAFGTAGSDATLAVDEDLSRLMGWVAPAPCWAVGVVAGGTAYPMAPPCTSPARGSRPPRGGTGARHVRMACFVGRDGEIASRAHHGAECLTAEAPTGGRTLDALQRCFGLPTPPPDRSSSELLSLLWLAEILTAGADRRLLAWADVAALHPAVRALAADGHPIPPDHLDGVLRTVGRAWSWSHLRLCAASAGWFADIVPPQLAGWMDDGMFARWLLESAVPLREVFAQARAALAPGVGDRLGRCLAAIGVDPG